MPAPTIDPERLDPARVTPTDRYRPADPVWVYRDGVWRAGIVELASPYAATVSYRSDGPRGLEVDIRTARYVSPREDIDPDIDLATQA
jgi:hypothetical protein